jgi:hypothetical protein
MRIYIGFDDTDTIDSDRGTGKLARWFENELPQGYHLWGVVRQQLLLDDSIAYTTHNSSACAIVENSDALSLDELIFKAVGHIERHFIPGSDPGLCIVPEGHPALSALISFGRLCTKLIVTQKDALRAASGARLSGHGGTNDGVIGAAAAVGLTVYGWSGRFIEFGGLRDFPEKVYVSDLERLGVTVVSIDRDARVPALEDMVNTKGWLRPRLWGGKPVLPVMPREKNLWETVEERKRKQTNREGEKEHGRENFLQGEREDR